MAISFNPNAVSLDWQADGGSVGSAVSLATSLMGDRTSQLVVGGRSLAGTGGVLIGGIARPVPEWNEIARLIRGMGGLLLGQALQVVPDVNGDGFEDLLVLGQHSTPTQSYGSAWFLYAGGAGAFSADPVWAVGHRRAPAKFGRPLASAGDVNGDGLGDIIIGCARTEKDHPTEGICAVYLGTRRGLASAPDWMVSGGSPLMKFGFAVNGVGDVNGDGFDDVAAGAPAYATDQPGRGAAFLYLGGPQGLATGAAWSAVGDEAWQWMGADLTGAGDLNQDGFDDVLVAAPGPIMTAERNPDWPGRVWVFAGSPEGLSPRPVAALPGFAPGEGFSRTLCRLGDMDGDGRVEVAVGAHACSQTLELRGAVYLYSIARDFSVEARGVLLGRTPREMLGWSLAAGDLNRDGYPDLIAGAPFRRETRQNEGHGGVEIVWGGPRSLAPAEGVLAALPASDPPAPSRSPSPWMWGGVLGAAGLGLVVWRQRWSRRIERARNESVADERARISRDLHDGVGSLLSVLAADARQAQAPLDNQPVPVTETLRRIERTAGQLTEGMSEIVWLNQPGNDTLECLVDRLSDHVAELASAGGFRCRLHVPPSLPVLALPNPFRRDLYFAAKEVLTNALRHSGGTQLEMHLGWTADALNLDFQDNGRGWTSPEPPPSRSGNGLNNVRERLHRHGGTVRIASGLGGTRITLNAPWPPRSSQARS